MWRVFQTQHGHLNSKNMEVKQLCTTSTSRMRTRHRHAKHSLARRIFGLKIGYDIISGIFQNLEGQQNVLTSTPRPSAPPFPEDVLHGFVCSVAVGNNQPCTGHGRSSVAASETVKQHNERFAGPQLGCSGFCYHVNIIMLIRSRISL